MPGNKRWILHVKGIVQGVGFRPFVYNLALSHYIKGSVFNSPDGVVIEAEGREEQLTAFMNGLLHEAPPHSHITGCEVQEEKPAGYEEFVIKESSHGSTHSTFISPDIAMCGDCLREMGDPRDRRFGYPFINCTNCGPRFTIIRGIPYDRPYTTMRDFTMCEDCSREYHDPANRRFHAQPVACPRCGPRVMLLDANGRQDMNGNEFQEARKRLKAGHILAVKGLGGYNLACDALDCKAIDRLRKRKKRDERPFALMARDLETAAKYCHMGEEERMLLQGSRKPIVLLRRKEEETGLPVGKISPDNLYLGMMLPYTPLHYLLFDEGLELLVMTSGNISGEPIFYTDNEALQGLGDIADAFLTHDRDIFIRTDDTVTSVLKGKEYIIRRSRGYVPLPVDISAAAAPAMGGGKGEGPGILACGGELKNTFCLVKGNHAFISHHIGDLENMETLQSFESGIEHFKRIFATDPGVIAYDLHPEYLSTKYALESSIERKIPVQHHHAHIAGCMVENGITEPVIGVAFDGTGYGEDGCIWGGEFFTGDYAGFRREAHLAYVPMPGGSQAIREPWRMAYSYLMQYGQEKLWQPELCSSGMEFLKNTDRVKVDMLKHQVAKGINSPLTSSMGRLFDGVSFLVGLGSHITYEGQAAIKLEKIARMPGKPYGYEIVENGAREPLVVHPGLLIQELIHDIVKGKDAGEISGRFHSTVVDFTVRVCEAIRCRRNISKVTLSGGVFQNRILLEVLMEKLEESGFQVYIHSRIPPNDGGVSLGQAAIALCKSVIHRM